MVEETSRITSEETFENGVVIYRRGDKAEHTYLLKEGKVDLIGEDGTVSRTVAAGQVFGETALVSMDAMRIHTARVTKDSKCLKIARQPLEAQLQNEDPFIAALFRILQGNMCNVMQMKKMPKEKMNALAKDLAETAE
ncbi:cyclic nucleotide-binding domain-containing protein [Aestuariispira insulae]|uniref:Cyclic nucleotide-binding domain-containing protein n=1 Tax=Aestuariispira insulae TaxID=1461337 RepID=A0A3D9HNF8_9PROT|nr:cyclic nucleotide-binding domain-containing protein [Aestuariispira insulae]RED51008.1 hypothetical protein DFP90_104284 [Aestuariispira insulae]